MGISIKSYCPQVSDAGRADIPATVAVRYGRDLVYYSCRDEDDKKLLDADRERERERERDG